MNPRSKRNRKRPRGGIGCLAGDGGDDSGGDFESPSSLLRVEVVRLSTAFDAISGDARGDERRATNADAERRLAGKRRRRAREERRVRIVRPYPFTFATFAKARWIGRTLVDVYHEEFGSYPRSYYEAAINAGRILVSGRRVACGYKVKGGDELTHTVHRHEPAVGLADAPFDDEGVSMTHVKGAPPVQMVHEDDDLLVVDKPATLPIHPCGGYNFNSLFEILSHWNPELYGAGKLFTVHRLDRLTSGLVLIAKSSSLARSLGKCIMGRDGCEKVYLARVKGKFPLNLQRMPESRTNDENVDRHPWKFEYNSPHRKSDPGNEESGRNNRLERSIPPCQYGETTGYAAEAWRGGLRVAIVNNEGNKKSQSNNNCESNQRESQSCASLGYWITDGRGAYVENASLRILIDQCEDVSMEEMLTRAIGPTTEPGSDASATKWLNFACPCRIASHKNGVCEAGDFIDLTDDRDRRGIKPAQTSLTLLSYDDPSDTSLVVARPVTGRTHQIRLHLQMLGHPIANDRCYGGEPWFGDEEGRDACERSREWLGRLDRGTGAAAAGSGAVDTNSKLRVVPANSTNADTPASEAEIYHAAANRPREEGESILDFTRKTCVWCARCRGVDDLSTSNDIAGTKPDDDSAVFRRTLMEYLVRSQGIWLHALQYSLKTKGENENETLRYRTSLPSWASM